MSGTFRRWAIGLALFAALGVGAGAAAESHHAAHQPSAMTHQLAAPRHGARSAPAHSVNAIPQGNGGDHDGDNNGGPSDGDGTI